MIKLLTTSVKFRMVFDEAVRGPANSYNCFVSVIRFFQEHEHVVFFFWF